LSEAERLQIEARCMGADISYVQILSGRLKSETKIRKGKIEEGRMEDRKGKIEEGRMEDRKGKIEEGRMEEGICGVRITLPCIDIIPLSASFAAIACKVIHA